VGQRIVAFLAASVDSIPVLEPGKDLKEAVYIYDSPRHRLPLVVTKKLIFRKF
jgi:hypothetical protein